MSKVRLWSGWIISVLAVLMLLLDAAGKFGRPIQVVDAFHRLGLGLDTAMLIGTLLTACTLLYAIPRTAILGAILLTGYLGGAVAIHVRAGSPRFETVFPALFGVVVWAGLVLRDARILPLLLGKRSE